MESQKIVHFYKAGIRNGDTLLEVDGRKLRDPQELINAL